MIGLILIGLMGAASDSPGLTASGQVTATNGTVFLNREGRRYRARVRSALRPGDRLETTAGAGAGLFLFDGHAVFLGPATVVAIGGTTRGGLIRLDRGELRVTVSGNGGMAIVTPQARAETGRGILHVAATPEGTRFWSERGRCEVSAGDRAPASIAEGQESFVAAENLSERPTDETLSRVNHTSLMTTTTATGAGWAVEPDALRLAGAAADSRRLKSSQVNEVNDGTALAFQASGQMRIGPGTGTGTGTGTGAGPAGTTPTTPEGEGVPPTTPEGTSPTTPGGTTPTTGEEGTNPTINPTTGDESATQPIAFAQTNTSTAFGSSSIAFSGASGAFSSAFSSGPGSDAQQDSRNPAFPGNIHLITTVNQYNLNQVHLTKLDTLFPSARSYYSIGLGPPPTHQVTTSFLTGTGATPNTIPIPHFDAYLINLNQYNIADPATTPPTTTLMPGISGLLGAHPTAPQIQNATPLTDSRARFNDRATFALGEFALDRGGRHGNIPRIELRRSDQDRQIIPTSLTTDVVTPNPDVSFVRAPDFRFFPEFGSRGVFVPQQGTFRFPPTVARLDLLRKAAVTTLLAETLLNYSHRTGQTQFAIGNQVFDVTGYHRPAPTTGAGTGTATGPRAGTGPAVASRAALGSSPGAARAGASASRSAASLPRGLAAAGARGHGGGLSHAPTLRSFGPNPEAARSMASAGAHHAGGPRRRH